MLANASVSSDDIRIKGLNLDDLIASRVQANDVPGLVLGIMARVRHAVGAPGLSGPSGPGRIPQ